MTFNHLPPHLIQCLAYCALFPSEHEFEADRLIELWMYEGLIQPKEKQKMEDIGEDFFNKMWKTSLFQLMNAYSHPCFGTIDFYG